MSVLICVICRSVLTRTSDSPMRGHKLIVDGLSNKDAYFIFARSGTV
jgi:hypothetical protein